MDWGGLEYNGGLTLMDGAAFSDMWYYAVVAFKKYGKGFPLSLIHI